MKPKREDGRRGRAEIATNLDQEACDRSDCPDQLTENITELEFGSERREKMRS